MTTFPGDRETWYFIFNVIGVIPFRSKRDQLVLSYIGYRVFLFVSFVHFILFWSIFNLNDTQLVTIALHVFMHLIYIALAAINNFTAIDEHKNLIIAVSHVLSTYEQLKMGFVSIASYLKVCLMVSTLLALLQGILLSSISMTYLSTIYSFTWAYIFINENGTTIVFSSLVNTTRSCLFHIIEELNNSCGTPRQKKLIAVFVPLYNHLVKSSDDMNRCFEIRLLIILLSKILRLIFEFYNWWSGKLPVTSAAPTSQLTTILYVAITLFGIGCLFVECESCRQEAVRFTNLLSDLALQNHNGEFEKNAHITMHFIVRKKLRFRIYGGLTLNYRLMLSLIATSFTYLMILLQFNKRGIYC